MLSHHKLLAPSACTCAVPKYHHRPDAFRTQILQCKDRALQYFGEILGLIQSARGTFDVPQNP